MWVACKPPQATQVATHQPRRPLGVTRGHPLIMLGVAQGVRDHALIK
jgi:hypothetical protein